MNYYLLIPLLLSIILIIILIIILKKKNNKLEEITNNFNFIKIIKRNELKSYFAEEWKNEQYGFEIKKKELDNELNKLNATLKEKEKRYEEVNQDLELYRKGKIEEIDGAGAEYEKRKRLLVDASIVQYREVRSKLYNEELASMQSQKEKVESEIEKIQAELEVERSKRDAINEEILRQRKVAEEQDFYKIKFSEQDKKDIEILRPIAPRLQHPEVINKIIWNSYYQKPLAELRKRLLPNGDISGIYKITRIKTNEIYIGQTTSIDRRFQDHVKTALGVGTLASSQFHRVMSEDGPENFYFEILEEVEKDKLRERESYYIDWFKSDKFGLNSMSGDKNK